MGRYDVQFTYRLLAILGGVLILMQAPANAQWWRGGSSNTSSRSTVSTASRSQGRVPQSRVPQARQVGDDEQQVMARVRAYQSQLQREEQLLQQRLKQADQLRQRGLQSKDQRVLDQAERYERQAMAAYQQRIKHFEGRNLGTPTKQPAARTPAPRRSYTPSRNATPQRQQARPQRSTRKTKSRKSWDWLRGWR
jgi:hypothetical protein